MATVLRVGAVHTTDAIDGQKNGAESAGNARRADKQPLTACFWKASARRSACVRGVVGVQQRESGRRSGRGVAGGCLFSQSSSSTPAGVPWQCRRERLELSPSSSAWRQRKNRSVKIGSCSSDLAGLRLSRETISSSSSSSSSSSLLGAPLVKRRSAPMAQQQGKIRAIASVDAPLANWSRQPRRIALFVEPSPFAYVCGYKNRFCNLIRYLREMGDEVMIVTTKPGAPKEFYGARVVGSASFPCPWYTILPLSLAASPRIYDEVKKFKPDIIHASSPGVMVFGALIFAKLLSLPLVLSYHTHVPKYIPKYTFTWLVKPMWAVIRFCHRLADLTLVTSPAVGEEMKAEGAAAAEKIMVWRMGVDSESFHPRWKNWETRKILSDGEPEKPLIVHVGRLGVEKNLAFLRILIDRLPGVRLAFVGDGPNKEELMKQFEGTPTVFTGMLTGEDLSRAYASADLFFTPSETETLGFVVLEAMASGVPVVAVRAGGIPDIVNKEGTTGFLYTPGDVEDALQKVHALIESKELRETVGEAGRKEVEKHDWRSATVHLRNEQYKAAVRYWLQKRRQKMAALASLSRLRFWWKQEERQAGMA